MNNIVTQKSKNIKRYLPHKIETRKYVVEMYRNCGDIEYVCRKYHISRTSLWRWNKKEDLRKQGTMYLKRSNRIPMAVLNYLTPKEKREELDLAV